MRYLIIFFFILAVALTSYGFYLQTNDMLTSERYIGLGVVIFFFVWMPLFLYHRWKDKNVKDYMLTDDSFKKMRDYEKNRSKKEWGLGLYGNKSIVSLYYLTFFATLPLVLTIGIMVNNEELSIKNPRFVLWINGPN